MGPLPTITASELAELNGRQSIEIIDVRSPIEFQEVRVAAARNVPLDVLDPHALAKNRGASDDQPLYVLCKSGARGAEVQQKFADAGYANVVNVEGGIDAYAAAGLPLIRATKVVSLERQVRIAAGFLVLTGAIATLVTGNAYFAAVPAFVGAGLMFAGITDSCGMGMLIAKMPWNQVTDNACCAAGK